MFISGFFLIAVSLLGASTATLAKTTVSRPIIGAHRTVTVFSTVTTTATTTQIITKSIFPPFSNCSASATVSSSSLPSGTGIPDDTTTTPYLFEFDTPLLPPSSPALTFSTINSITFLSDSGMSPYPSIYQPVSNSTASQRFVHSPPQYLRIASGRLLIQAPLDGREPYAAACLLDFKSVWISAQLRFRNAQLRVKFRGGGYDCEAPGRCNSQRWEQSKTFLIGAAELENGPVEVRRDSERLGGGRWELMRFWEVSAVEVVDGADTGSVPFGIDDLEVVRTCGSWVTIGMA